MPFHKGQSGNPGGRPKRKWTWVDLLEEVGETIEKQSGLSYKKLVAQRLWLAAINGNMFAVTILQNRMDGMPQINQDVTSGGKPMGVASLLEQVQNEMNDQKIINADEQPKLGSGTTGSEDKNGVGEKNTG